MIPKAAGHDRAGSGAETPSIEIVLPVHNEEAQLEASVERLRAYLDGSFPFSAVITIADNASTDATWAIARRLANRPGIGALHLDEKGRGRALRRAWLASPSLVVAYMDVDLATDLDALLPLVAPLLSGHSDVAIGTRLAASSRVVRGPKREVLSRGYNLLVRAAAGSHFSDAQCGFKALRRETAQVLVPLVRDDEWFFDTELLVIAERNGLRIHEIPVDWVDDPDSRVRVWETSVDDVRGLWRVWREHPRLGGRGTTGVHRPPRNAALARFVGVGLVSTVVYLLLYLVLRAPLGLFGANAVALALCTVANTFAHGRYTFAEDGSMDLGTGILAGCTVYATTLALTSLALGVAEVLAPASLPGQLVGLVVALLAAAFIRFVVLRAWMIRSNRRPARHGLFSAAPVLERSPLP
jgi:glycosyltransferase involved in cell wall biosynthesis